jgi:hypothetical protein
MKHWWIHILPEQAVRFSMRALVLVCLRTWASEGWEEGDGERVWLSLSTYVNKSEIEEAATYSPSSGWYVFFSTNATKTTTHRQPEF